VPLPATAATALRWSPDGRLLATGGEDGAVQLWDAATGARWLPPLPHPQPVRALRFSPDGAALAVVLDHSAAVWLWTLAPAPRAVQLEDLRWQSGDAFAADFDPDAPRLVIRYRRDRNARVFRLAPPPTGAEAPELVRFEEQLDELAFLSPPGVLLLAGRSTAVVRLPTREHRAFELPSPLALARVSADGRRLAAQGLDQTLRVWDTATRDLVAAIELAPEARLAAVSPDGGQLVLVDAEGAATAWSLTAPWPSAPRQVLAAGPQPRDGVWSPDGQWLVTSSFHGIDLWEVATGRRVLRYRLPPEHSPWRLTLSPRGDAFVNRSLHGELAICRLAAADCWLLSAGRSLPRDVGYTSTWPVAFSPDGRWLAAAIADHRVQLWDLESGDRHAALTHGLADALAPGNVETARLSALSFSADGQRLLTASTIGSAQLWDVASGAPLGPPLRHPSGAAITSAKLSPDGERLLTADDSGTAFLWHGQRAEPLGQLAQGARVTHALFSPDGSRIATFGGASVAHLWDATTLRLLYSLEHTDEVRAVAFSADGARLLSVADFARVWDAATGQPLGPPLRHRRLPAELLAELAAPPASGAPVDAARAAARARERTTIYRAVLSPDAERLLTLGLDEIGRASCRERVS
jgi:WD40 repeat protein